MSGLPLEEMILPQYLKPLGYATGAFGKWNLGFGPGARPTERGFDEFLGHASGNIHYFKHLYHGQNDMRSGVEAVDLSGQYSTDIFAVAAADFIHRHKDKPWFVYLPFNAVHFVSGANVTSDEKIEWQVPSKYLALFGAPPNETDPKLRFLATLAALDDAIGRLLKTLEDLQLRERTFVLLISDNGAFMRPLRGLEVQSNRPLREGGVTTYEGGVRVPAIFRWPDKLRPGKCNEMLASLDVLPTLVSAAGGALPKNRTVDRKDMLRILSGKQKSPHKALHWVWKQNKDEHWQAMRKGRWKIVRSSKESAWELYDLKRDIAESHDQATSKKSLTQRLAEEFSRWHEGVLRERGLPIKSDAR